MKAFYDLHIHSCLSPCASNDMTPNNIVNMALLNGMNIIALTDHNSCKNCRATLEVGQKNGLVVIPGMELCTSEEIHVVCLFPNLEQAESFSDYVYSQLIKVKNKPEIFGEQIIMDKNDDKIGEIDNLLLLATKISIESVNELVKNYGGVSFPAHIDRDSYSILSSLGTIPKSCGFNCAEVSKQANINFLKQNNPILNKINIVQDSDAHYLENMPYKSTFIELNNINIKHVLNYINLPYYYG